MSREGRTAVMICSEARPVKRPPLVALKRIHVNTVLSGIWPGAAGGAVPMDAMGAAPERAGQSRHAAELVTEEPLSLTGW